MISESITNENLYFKFSTVVVAILQTKVTSRVTGPRTKFHLIHVFLIFYLKYLRRIHYETGSWYHPWMREYYARMKTS